MTQRDPKFTHKRQPALKHTEMTRIIEPMEIERMEFEQEINPFAGLDPDRVGNAQIDDAYLASEEADFSRTGKQLIREERRAQVLGMRRNHVGFRQIGEKLGISTGTAHRLWSEALESLVPIEALDDARRAEIDRIERMRLAWIERARTDVAAARVWMGLTDRFIKVMGLDQFPDPVEIDVHGIGSVQEADQLIMEMAEKYRRKPVDKISMN